MIQKKIHTFIDVFAGAGGLAEGFISNGFEAVAHIEMNKHACDTLITRSAYYHLKRNNKLEIYYQYIRKEITREKLLSYIPQKILNKVINATISNENITDVFNRIKKNTKADTQIDVLVGGPPCQAYSLVGRAVSGSKIVNDPRNFLYELYIKFLNEFEPKIFVFENVQGLMSANNGSYISSLREKIKLAGYTMDLRILKASDYGVLQNRKRIIIIGIRNDLTPDDIYPEKNNTYSTYFIRDLLNDLPFLDDKQENRQYVFGPTEYCLKTGIRNASDVLTWHEKRYVNDHDKKIYALAISSWNKNRKRLLYTDINIEDRTHKNHSSFLDRFKVVAADKHEAHTVLAHIAKDGHYFIHPDLKQCRSISVREAARLQSFPDSFYFEGNRTSVFTQIGNAVPPLMSSAIALKILKYLEKQTNGKH